MPLKRTTSSSNLMFVEISINATPFVQICTELQVRLVTAANNLQSPKI